MMWSQRPHENEKKSIYLNISLHKGAPEKHKMKEIHTALCARFIQLQFSSCISILSINRCEFRDLIIKTSRQTNISTSHFILLLWLYLMKCPATLLLPTPSPCLHFMSCMMSADMTVLFFYGRENKCLLSPPCSRCDNRHFSTVCKNMSCVNFFSF